MTHKSKDKLMVALMIVGLVFGTIGGCYLMGPAKTSVVGGWLVFLFALWALMTSED